MYIYIILYWQYTIFVVKHEINQLSLTISSEAHLLLRRTCQTEVELGQLATGQTGLMSLASQASEAGTIVYPT